MNERCDCLKCALGKVLEERFPGGFGAEETIAALNAIASVSGWLLAPGGEQTIQSFFALIRSERDVQRETEARPGGGLQ